MRASLLSKPSPGAWRPCVLREAGQPLWWSDPHQGGPLCRLQPLGGPAPAAILPTAPLPPHVTGGTTGQKPSTRALPAGPLCPPHATSLPSLEAAASGLAAQPSTPLPLRLQSTSLERLSPKFYPPAKTAQIKCHFLCEHLPGLPGGGRGADVTCLPCPPAPTSRPSRL